MTHLYCCFGGGLCANAGMGGCEMKFSGLTECQIYYQEYYRKEMVSK